MPKTLDRSRKFSTTYGDDPRRFYQDGVYFDAAGHEYGAPKPAPDNGPGRAVGRAGEAPAKAAERQPEREPEPPPQAEPSPPPTDEELRAQLAPLNFGQVKKLFVKAGGPDDIKGAGAQARMVDWLIAHARQTVAPGA